MALLDIILKDGEYDYFKQFLNQFHGSEEAFYRREEIIRTFDEFCKNCGLSEDFRVNSVTRKLLDYVQELVCGEESLFIVIRRRIGLNSIKELPYSEKKYRDISVEQYLKVRDGIILGKRPEECQSLEIDMDPFIRWPLIKDSRNIGKGIYYLIRYLSSQLFNNREVLLNKVLEFLKVHTEDGVQLMLSPTVSSLKDLEQKLEDAVEFLEDYLPETPFMVVKDKLAEMGFEAGWGNNVGRTIFTMELLNSVLDNPDHEVVSEFFSRIPMVHKIAIISPHGWFAQENVLGRPDTGGQVVYILNQVKALEDELVKKIRESGLNIEPRIVIVTRLIPEAEGTPCDTPLEDVIGTKYTKILRVPFRTGNKEWNDKWISRFDIWPYLEDFAKDASKAVLPVLDGWPDLILGNYSDGNLVAYLMSRELKVSYCTIAHALEKTKYVNSDLNWKELDDQYHFSLQFTADLLAMTGANITITSTYQEIAGTESSIGQYEAYRHFNMPDLFRVKSGSNMFHPRFNIIPPGVDQEYFYPFSEVSNRDMDLNEELTNYVFNEGESETSRGELEDPNKKPIYSIARLDKIKNITGLVEAFGKSKKLREVCNLVIVSGHVDKELSTDQEEQAQIDLMYDLIDKYDLKGSFRWLEMETNKSLVGEYYRIMADRGGVFVQPALFEAFGLTVLEAMISGLPTIATRFGGPQETIVHGESGCHLNPFDHGEIERTILPLVSGKDHDQFWKKISQNGVQRVLEKFTWEQHASELIKLSKIYGFWSFATAENAKPLNLYVDTLFQLLYRPMAAKLLEKHNKDKTECLSLTK